MAARSKRERRACDPCRATVKWPAMGRPLSPRSSPLAWLAFALWLALPSAAGCASALPPPAGPAATPAPASDAGGDKPEPPGRTPNAAPIDANDTARHGGAPVTGPVRLSDGRVLAVVVLKARVVECSNLGGEHDVFQVDERGDGGGRPPPRVVLGGGHGQWTRLVPGVGPISSPGPAYIGEISWGAAPPDDAGWCLDSLPPAAGRVRNLKAAHDLESARAALRKLTRP